MFPSVIEKAQTRFTTEIADELFSNIYSRSYRGDYSMLATLRALLWKRVPKDESITTCFVDHPGIMTVGDYDSAEHLLNQIAHVPDHEIMFINLRERAERAKAIFEIFDFHMNGWELFEAKADLQRVMANSMNIRVYVRTDGKASIVVADNLNITRWHLLQCISPRLLPYYFSNNKPTPEEFSFLRAINGVENEEGRVDPALTRAAYLEKLEMLANEIDFRSYMVEKVTSGVQARIADANIKSTQSRIEDIRISMSNSVDTYRRLVRDLETQSTILAGYEARKVAGEVDDELTDFMKRNKQIYPVRSTDEGFQIIVATTMDGYDPDMYETISSNSNSHMWHGYEVTHSDFITRENRKLLLDAIFGPDAEFKLNVCAFFELGLHGYVSTLSHYGFSSEFKDYMPNPHLNIHECFGDHRPLIDSRLEAGDILGAIVQCQASAGSINWGESVTVRPFLRGLFDGNAQKVIRMADGSFVTPSEALAYLKEKEGNND